MQKVLAIARADFLERVRGYSFFVTLMAAIYLGYAAATGKILMLLDDYRGVYTAGWIGLMMALITTAFVSLIGFYVVKNAVERDRMTGTGQILAATPMSRRAYMLGKLLSNFLVLATVVAVMACAAVILFFAAAEDRRFDAWALLSPLLLIALPAMALVAALALFFETSALLKGGFGNILWFFLWGMGIALPGLAGAKRVDPSGLWWAMDSLRPLAATTIPGYKNGMSLTIDPGRKAKIAEALHLPGIHWTAESIVLRLLWVGVAVLLALIAALVFDRFDSARFASILVGRARGKREDALIENGGGSETGESDVATQRVRSAARLAPIAATGSVGAFGRLIGAELRLALQGLKWWWYAVAAGLLVAEFVAPLEASRGLILAFAWLWPALLWSQMGAREKKFGTSALLFSSARILPRQLAACFAAGFAVAAVTGAGAGLRLLAARDWTGFAAWLVAALLIPAAALCFGVLSGSSKFFEAVYVVAWYVGPLNRTPGLDFTGAANGPLIMQYARIYTTIAVAAVLAAALVRARQTRHQ
jgi:ABC-2 family transporter protein